ncbi:MAG: hypothetical protein Q8Q28_10755 [Pseudomonadota bacterium]|nr:hypothetical protein [Pseudomonadota bacterium]
MMASARRGLIGKAASKAIALLRLTHRRFNLFAITLNVRKATQPEPKLKAIYEALGLHPLPGGTKKMVA